MMASASSVEDIIAEARVEARGLSCFRGGRILFKNLDFILEPGQAALVRGPNGVGKSSLLRVIAGLLRPVNGVIKTKGGIALCDDRLALDLDKTLGQALRFWADLDGANTASGAEWMAAFGLSHLADIPVRYFSTGQRQRAKLARTMASGAHIWLLDEPANGLDTESIALLGAAMREHLKGDGIILAASHFDLPVTFDFEISLT